MGSGSSLSLNALLEGVVALSVLLVVVAATTSRTRDLVIRYWMLGWAALLCSGGAFALASQGGMPDARFAAYAVDALVAPLMYMGALELRGLRPAYRWPVAVGVVAGLARAGIDATGSIVLDVMHSATIAPAFLIAAAVSVARAPRDVRFRHPISILLLLYVGVEWFDAYRDLGTGSNVIVWIPLITVCIPLAAAQIASRLLAMGDQVALAGEVSDQAELERFRFHALFDHVHELVAELSLDSTILYVNARVKDLLGLDPQALIGLRGLDFVPEERRAEMQQEFAQRVADAQAENGTPSIVEIPNTRGELRHIEFTMSDYGFPGEPRLLVLARDVTERQEADRLLEAQRQELERRVEERTEELRASLLRLRDEQRLATVGTLASGIAHQINNPVGAISAAAEFALLSNEGPDRDAIREEALIRIVEEARRAGRIVKSILRFASHGTTNKWPEDLVAVVRRSVELVRPYAGDRRASIEVMAPNEALHVSMSPIEIEQLTVNLIRNAAESNEKGARIAVRVHGQGDHAVLEVADDGRGMSPETRARAFDPFFTTRLRDGGSGLGLSVVHGIVIDHGGSIEIESETDAGCRIEIRFPIDRP